MSAFITIILMAIVGAIGVIIFPDPHFNLVGNLVCPQGSTFSQEAVQLSYHEPGEYTFLVSCLTEDGEDLATGASIFKAIFLILGGYFLIFFLGSLAWQLRAKVIARNL